MNPKYRSRETIFKVYFLLLLFFGIEVMLNTAHAKGSDSTAAKDPASKEPMIYATVFVRLKITSQNIGLFCMNHAPGEQPDTVGEYYVTCPENSLASGHTSSVDSEAANKCICKSECSDDLDRGSENSLIVKNISCISQAQIWIPTQWKEDGGHSLYETDIRIKHYGQSLFIEPKDENEHAFTITVFTNWGRSPTIKIPVYDKLLKTLIGDSAFVAKGVSFKLDDCPNYGDKKCRGQ